MDTCVWAYTCTCACTHNIVNSQSVSSATHVYTACRVLGYMYSFLHMFTPSIAIHILLQEMREQLDIVLQQKVSSPRMDLYTPLSTTPPASSQLIQSIIDLIASEDYQWQVRHARYIQDAYYVDYLFNPVLKVVW